MTETTRGLESLVRETVAGGKVCGDINIQADRRSALCENKNVKIERIRGRTVQKGC